jgi:hypothetical protein
MGFDTRMIAGSRACSTSSPDHSAQHHQPVKPALCRGPGYELTALEERQADRDALDLLDALPTASGRLGELPQPVLCRLFQAFHLKVEYDRHTNWATIEVTLGRDDLEELQQAAAATLHAAQTKAEDVSVGVQGIEQSSVAHALGLSPVTTMDK